MADFRKWFYALAMVGLIAGLTVPANAQGGVVTCTASTVPTLIRAQAYADLVGDYTLTCSGGTPTVAGGIVPAVNVQVFLSTNITSKLTTSSGTFDEALLIIDDPNTPAHPSTPILNCGNTGAPDNTNSGPGICQIVSDGNPADTYNGTPGTAAVPAGTNPVTPAVPAGPGHPNIFQGRLASSQATGINSSIVFAGVPFDPPGTTTTRSLRITNVRADAEILGVASSFVQQNVTMSVSFSGSQTVTITNLTAQQNVATILNGLTVASSSNTGFLQCDSENAKLFAGTTTTCNGTATAVNGTGVGGLATATAMSNGCNVPGTGGYTTQPQVVFTEGFQNAWKTKNIAFLTTDLGNGSFTSTGSTYSFTANYPTDAAQNIPGVNYNTESGFEYATGQTILTTNPPSGVSPVPVANTNGSLPLTDSATGIALAGVATQGTRLAASFTNLPSGANIYVPPVILLNNGTTVTGVMVYTTTAADGSGSFTPPSGLGAVSYTTAASGTGSRVYFGTNPLVQVSNGIAVYEILFADPSSVETATVPVAVAYAANLASNPPVGLPATGATTQVTGGFAPFYTSTAARAPSFTLPVPRFIAGTATNNIFSIVKCACDLLFPYVVSHDGFDTGIAVSNTSTDPFATLYGTGNGATPQQGTVTFYYYGTGAGGQAQPAPQTSSVVPSGQVLTYVLSSGAGNVGTTGANGLDGRAGTGQFQGYMIAVAGFQYCHGFAFISPLGGGPLSPGVSEGYLALEIDGGGALPRTTQSAEIKAN